MTIFGVALLALCTILGNLLGEALGQALGVKANVGGVGIAMLLLIAARIGLARRGLVVFGAAREAKSGQNYGQRRGNREFHG